MRKINFSDKQKISVQSLIVLYASSSWSTCSTPFSCRIPTKLKVKKERSRPHRTATIAISGPCRRSPTEKCHRERDFRLFFDIYSILQCLLKECLICVLEKQSQTIGIIITCTLYVSLAVIHAAAWKSSGLLLSTTLIQALTCLMFIVISMI